MALREEFESTGNWLFRWRSEFIASSKFELDLMWAVLLSIGFHTAYIKET